jgi:flagellar basal body-associated protein FliL
MSKRQNRQKYRKQKQKQGVPWVILAIGGVMLVLAAFLFARQGGGDEGGTPSIAVDQQQIDYGDVKFGVNKTFAIKVTNTGDGTLRFKEKPYIQVLEGC